MIETLSAPLEVAGVPVHLGVSVGIALATSDRATSGDLLRYSDIAMYRAKRSGRGGYRVYNPDLDTGETRRLHRENQLRRALDREELSLRFQPIVDLATGGVRGAEVLARWEHPERGTLPPEDFIPLAEETGLIAPLGDWILREACRHLHSWRGTLPESEPFTLSVNLSGRQFSRPELFGEIEHVLRSERMDPSRLQLEITESWMIRAMSRARKLKELGVRLAVDDFGTGYSPFTYLKEVEVDALKIDRSFVQGLGRIPADGVITRTILQLADGLGLPVVAEGVETPEQQRILLEGGCPLAQGFLFAPPLSASDFEEVLRKGLT